MLKNKLRKAYISIEIVILASIVLIGGIAGTSAFLKNGQNAQGQSATAINDTINMIGEEFDFEMSGEGLGDLGGIAGIPDENGISYYDDLAVAASDLNSGEFGANANAGESGKIVAYVNTDGKAIISLNENVTSSSTAHIEADAELFLNGYSVIANGTSAISVDSGSFTVNATATGSSVIAQNAGAGSAIVQNGGSITLKGGKYAVEGANSGSALKVAAGTMNVSNITVDAQGTNTMYGIAIQTGADLNGNNLRVFAEGSGTSYGVYSAGEFTIDNSDIRANSTAAKTRALYLTSAGNGTISNSEIVGTCDLYQSTSKSSSQGVNNAGTLTINNCNVWGSHSGLTNSGALVVNGGTYESPGHGGMYFGNLTTPARIRDAVLRHSTIRPENSTSEADYNKAGFYVGGGSDRNGVVIYMDNCEIYGELNSFVLRGTSNEHDNTLYISNSRLTGPGNVRIDNNTHKLYLGVGNNFDGSDAATSTGVAMTSQVFHTTETYR